MTATRYASIALSGRVVACGNSIFKLSETTPNNLIGHCREKSLLICIGFNIFQLLSVTSPKTVGYVTMDWLLLKCVGLEYRVARNGVMGLHGYTNQNTTPTDEPTPTHTTPITHTHTHTHVYSHACRNVQVGLSCPSPPPILEEAF